MNDTEGIQTAAFVLNRIMRMTCKLLNCIKVTKYLLTSVWMKVEIKLPDVCKDSYFSIKSHKKYVLFTELCLNYFLQVQFQRPSIVRADSLSHYNALLGYLSRRESLCPLLLAGRCGGLKIKEMSL